MLNKIVSSFGSVKCASEYVNHITHNIRVSFGNRVFFIDNVIVKPLTHSTATIRVENAWFDI